MSDYYSYHLRVDCRASFVRDRVNCECQCLDIAVEVMSRVVQLLD